MIKSLLTYLLPAKWTQEGSELHVQGESVTVYWVSAESEEKMGKTTAFNTIYLNERIKHEYPQHLVKYVALHEKGHASQTRGSRIKYYTLTHLFPLLSLLLPFSPYIAAEHMNWGGTMVGALSAVALLAAIFLCEATRRIMWKEELHAELNALDTLGLVEFARRRDELEEMRDRGIGGKIRRKLNYPTLVDVLATSQAS